MARSPAQNYKKKHCVIINVYDTTTHTSILSLLTLENKTVASNITSYTRARKDKQALVYNRTSLCSVISLHVQTALRYINDVLHFKVSHHLSYAERYQPMYFRCSKHCVILRHSMVSGQGHLKKRNGVLVTTHQCAVTTR